MLLDHFNFTCVCARCERETKEGGGDDDDGDDDDEEELGKEAEAEDGEAPAAPCRWTRSRSRVGVNTRGGKRGEKRKRPPGIS